MHAICIAINSLKQHIHAVVETCNANLVIYKDYEESAEWSTFKETALWNVYAIGEVAFWVIACITKFFEMVTLCCSW